MSDHPSAERDAQVAAAAWLVRLREPDASAEDLAAWLRWCNEAPLNRRTFVAIQELWMLAHDAGIAAPPDVQELQEDQYDGQLPVAEWRHRRAVAQRPSALSPRSSRWDGPMWGRLGACAAALVLILASTVFASRNWPFVAVSRYTTGAGQQRALRLPDDSVVTLGGDSTLLVSYTRSRRSLKLLAGEAFFDVHHNVTWPFIVQTHDMAVKAVGTAFNVRADGSVTVVDVARGVVEITSADTNRLQFSLPGDDSSAGRSSHLFAGAGEEVMLDTQGPADVMRVSERGTEDVSAQSWQDGILTFIDEPLRSVVARLNRNSRVSIVLGNPLIGDMRFTGTILRGQISDWARGIAQVFPVYAVTRSDGTIVLEPRAAPVHQATQLYRR